MSLINYYLVENPIYDGYFARLKANGGLDSKEFIELMAILNPELDKDSIKKYLKATVGTAEYVLAEGKSITVSDFLRISPTLKGSFKSLDEPFNSRENAFGVNCTVLKGFVERVRKNVTIERIDPPVNAPEIGMVRDLLTGENVIRLDEANRFVGTNMIPNNCELAGIEVTNAEKVSESALIERSELIISRHSSREIAYTFRRSFTPPAWLVNNLNISVKLIYSEERREITRESSPVDCIWMS